MSPCFCCRWGGGGVFFPAWNKNAERGGGGRGGLVFAISLEAALHSPLASSAMREGACECKCGQEDLVGSFSSPTHRATVRLYGTLYSMPSLAHSTSSCIA